MGNEETETTEDAVKSVDISGLIRILKVLRPLSYESPAYLAGTLVVYLNDDRDISHDDIEALAEYGVCIENYNGELRVALDLGEPV